MSSGRTQGLSLNSARLERRIIVATGATALVSGLLFLAHDLYSHRDFKEHELVTQSAFIGSQLQAALDFGDVDGARSVLRDFTDADNIAFVVLCDDNNEILVAEPSSSSTDASCHPRDTVLTSVRTINAGENYTLILKGRADRLFSRAVQMSLIVCLFVLISVAMASLASRRVRATIVALFEQQQAAEQKLEAERQRAEVAVKAKSNFLANMSHEIRTPLNGMLGSVELLCATKLDTDQMGFADILRSSSEALLNVVNDILDYSRFESGSIVLQPEPADVRTLVGGTLKLFGTIAQAKGVALHASTDRQVPRSLLVDVPRLRQVLSNLVSNAVKFTAEGTIEVRIRVGTEPDTYLFEVEDHGIGIAHDRVDHIFSRFEQADPSTTRAYGGTGLGLSIAQQIVHIMGGTIAVRSTLRKGSTFSFTLPAVEAAPMSEDVEETFSDLLHREQYKLRILVCEDNKINATIARHMLVNLGCSVDIASDGLEGVSMAQGTQYDIIFMDCQMPNMDGYQATELIRGGKGAPPIFALTANIMEADLERCRGAGMEGWVAKPVTSMALIPVLKGVRAKEMGTPGRRETSWGRFDPGVETEKTVTVG